MVDQGMSPIETAPAGCRQKRRDAPMTNAPPLMSVAPPFEQAPPREQAKSVPPEPAIFTNCGDEVIVKATAKRLKRVPFKVSRLMEFCTHRELVNQTGHDVWDWPLVIVKELVDNALDAAEEAEIAPVVSIIVDGDTIAIGDNGPGIPAETIAGVLDYAIRVSSREAYVSPTRGAQGNALKTANGLRPE
jgi:hypothetical protein